MREDEDLDCCVRFSFPDESYETFEEWLDAQRSDDVDAFQSLLWQGGGQWTLYGLALLLKIKVVVHTVDSETLELRGAAHGTELVDARAGAAGAVVRLASMRAADGEPNHFDFLVDAANAPPNAQPLGRAASRRLAPADTPLRAGAPRLSGFLGWAALNVLAVAVYLSCVAPPAEDGSAWLQFATAAQHAAAQAAQTLLAPEAGAWSAAPRLLTGAGLVPRPMLAGLSSGVEVAIPPMPELVAAVH